MIDILVSIGFMLLCVFVRLFLTVRCLVGGIVQFMFSGIDFMALLICRIGALSEAEKYFSAKTLIHFDASQKLMYAFLSFGDTRAAMKKYNKNKGVSEDENHDNGTSDDVV